MSVSPGGPWPPLARRDRLNFPVPCGAPLPLCLTVMMGVFQHKNIPETREWVHSGERAVPHASGCILGRGLLPLFMSAMVPFAARVGSLSPLKPGGGDCARAAGSVSPRQIECEARGAWQDNLLYIMPCRNAWRVTEGKPQCVGVWSRALFCRTNDLSLDFQSKIFYLFSLFLEGDG